MQNTVFNSVQIGNAQKSEAELMLQYASAHAEAWALLCTSCATGILRVSRCSLNPGQLRFFFIAPDS